MRKPWEIGRRAVLKGTGVAIGLPFLEAMIPGEKRARAAGTAPARRMFLYLMEGGTPDTTGVTGGGRPGSLWPRTQGAGYETTSILKPFETMNLKKDITVVSNMNN